MKTCQLTLASIMIALLLLGCSRTDREPEAVPKDQVTIEKPADQTFDIAESTDARDKAESLVENTTESSNQAVTTTGASPSVPEIITLENKKGKIILPHKMHSATIACKECHGDADPGPMELGQEKGHALCQGCHKEKGAGPTTCNGCHEKKAIKAVEGC